MHPLPVRPTQHGIQGSLGRDNMAADKRKERSRRLTICRAIEPARSE